VIRELFGKLGNRTEVRGIVVSMSGFTAGAIKQVQDYAAQATILLCGPADTQSIFEFNDTFTTLLDQKLKEFVIRRR
jgi:hypothetical protein